MTTVPPLHTCQPRFVLYCIAHNLHEGDEWHIWEYIIWAGRMADTYKRHIGERYISDHDAFTHWIREQVGNGKPEQLTLGLAI